MSTGALDPLIHDPGRLRVVATLAALPDGDTLSVTGLQDICLRELDHAGYVQRQKTGGDRAQTTVTLTGDGRAALDRYTAVLRSCSGWPGRIISHQHPTCASAMLTGTPLPRPWVSTSRKVG